MEKRSVRTFDKYISHRLIFNALKLNKIELDCNVTNEVTKDVDVLTYFRFSG